MRTRLVRSDLVVDFKLAGVIHEPRTLSSGLEIGMAFVAPSSNGSELVLHPL